MATYIINFVLGFVFFRVSSFLNGILTFFMTLFLHSLLLIMKTRCRFMLNDRKFPLKRHIILRYIVTNSTKILQSTYPLVTHIDIRPFFQVPYDIRLLTYRELMTYGILCGIRFRPGLERSLPFWPFLFGMVKIIFGHSKWKKWPNGWNG